MVRRLFARLTARRNAPPAAKNQLEPDAIQNWSEQLRSQVTEARAGSEDLREKYKDVPLRARRPKKEAEAKPKSKSTSNAQKQPARKKSTPASKSSPTAKKQTRG